MQNERRQADNLTSIHVRVHAINMYMNVNKKSIKGITEGS